jgi:hypothetical protein
MSCSDIKYADAVSLRHLGSVTAKDQSHAIERAGALGAAYRADQPEARPVRLTRGIGQLDVRSR